MTTNRYMLLLAFFTMAFSLRVFAQNGGSDTPPPPVIGGTEANIADHPWQVALTSADLDQFCGGSIIDSVWILTAAHCVERGELGDLRIVAGIDRLDRAATGQVRKVTQVIIYPGYTSQDGYSGDVALLRLDRPLNLTSNFVKVIPMTTPEMEEMGFTDPGVTATTTGWGVTGLDPDDDNSTNRLMVASLPIISLETANQWLQGFEGFELITINETMLPCGFEEGGVSSCYGDSGGPLTVESADGKTTLAGVVSWGPECAGERAPAVYARVSYFFPWIQEITRIGLENPPALQNDLEVLGVEINDVIFPCGGSNIPKAMVLNAGVNEISSANIAVNISNNIGEISKQSYDYTFSPALKSGWSTLISLEEILLEENQEFTYSVTIAPAEDENLENNSYSKVITQADPYRLRMKVCIPNEFDYSAWVLVNMDNYSEVAGEDYNQSDAGTTKEIDICLGEGTYMFYGFSLSNDDCTFVIELEKDGEWIELFRDSRNGGFQNTYFSLPFEQTYDLGLSVSATNNVICGDEEAQSPVLYIQNEGTMQVNSFKVEVNLNGSQNEYEFETSLGNFQSDQFEISQLKYAIGMNNISTKVVSINGDKADSNPENDHYQMEQEILLGDEKIEIIFNHDENSGSESFYIHNENMSMFEYFSMWEMENKEDHYSKEMCVMEGCYQLVISGWEEISNSNEYPIIIKAQTGQELLSISSNEFEINQSFEFCVKPLSVRNGKYATIGKSFPNPTNSTISFELNAGTDAMAEIFIRDNTGKLYSQHSKQVVAGENSLEFNLAELTTGTYFAEVIFGGERHLFNFIVIK